MSWLVLLESDRPELSNGTVRRSWRVRNVRSSVCKVEQHTFYRQNLHCIGLPEARPQKQSRGTQNISCLFWNIKKEKYGRRLYKCTCTLIIMFIHHAAAWTHAHTVTRQHLHQQALRHFVPMRYIMWWNTHERTFKNVPQKWQDN